MFNFTFYTPTKVVFGKDTELQTADLLKEFGAKKILVHYGQKSVIRSGLLDRIKKSLAEKKLAFVELGGVVPNPRMSLIYKGIDLCKKEGVDFILAVGGGSVIDSAKAIGYGIANKGDAWDFYEHTRMPSACAPVGVVLTLSATGSEMSNSSVITNDIGQKKRGCNSDLCRPKFAVMNPELTMTVSDYQTACGSVDIMMHTLERYFTQGGNMDITDALAEGLLKTVMKYAVVLRDDPKNYEARAEMMWAGSLSHNGLTGCGNDGGDWACHGLEHELSGIFDVAHGAGLAAIWASWARFVYKNCLPRFKKFAENVMNARGKNDEEIALDGIKRLENFFRELKMPTSIRELGISPTDDEMKTMARKCIEGGGGKKGSAKILHEADAYEIYKMAL